MQAVHTDGGTGVGKGGSGAGHGGMGGSGYHKDSGGLFYNLVTDPMEPGSNGISDAITAQEETIGGGVLIFEVSGTAIIDGEYTYQ